MKRIPDFPDYYVTEDGDVYTTRPRFPHKEPRDPVLLRPVICSGYLYVTLCGDHGRRKAGVHQLVAEAFIEKPDGIPDGKLQVRHKDGSKTNNLAGNLQWGDARMNLNDRYEHGTMTHGERNGCAKLTVVDVLEIRRRRIAGERCRDIASLFGLSPQEIHRIGIGKRWGHIPGQTATRQRSSRRNHHARAVS